MKYYYLIASLPELSLDDPMPVVDVNNTLEFIQRNLYKDDLLLSRYLLYPNDNQNLINLIFQEYHLPSCPCFRTPSIFSADELRQFLKTGQGFPAYMTEYMMEYRKQFSKLSLSMIAEYLWIAFYKEVARLNHPFISAYFEFDKLLRQIAAAQNFNLVEDSVYTELIDYTIIRELGLGKPGRILSKTYPFIEKLWNSLDSRDPEQIERAMDGIRWEFIDTYELTASFTSAHVFGWILKLKHYARWAGLNEEQGRMRFEEICSEAVEASGIAQIEQL